MSPYLPGAQNRQRKRIFKIFDINNNVKPSDHLSAFYDCDRYCTTYPSFNIPELHYRVLATSYKFSSPQSAQTNFHPWIEAKDRMAEEDFQLSEKMRFYYEEIKRLYPESKRPNVQSEAKKVLKIEFRDGRRHTVSSKGVHSIA